MNIGMRRIAALSVFAIAAFAGPPWGTAHAASDPLFDSGATPVFETVATGDTSTSDVGTTPSEITITGEPDPEVPDESVTLSGDYVIAAGGSRQNAVLGSLTFDSTGVVVTGTISIISAAAASTTSSIMRTGGDDGYDGGDVAPVSPAPEASAVVTDCTATGGTYTLTASGAGEAQLELDCAGSGSTATWRLFVITTDGFTQAQQVRAVQIDGPGTADDGIIDLILTLR